MPRISRFIHAGVTAFAFVLAHAAQAQIPGGSQITVNQTGITGGTNGNCLYDNSGKVGEQVCGGTATSVTVGTTLVASGTTGRLLYDNAGTLGELATTGTGNVVLATSPTIAGATVTGSFTATGLVTNADLTNAGLTLGSTALTLGVTTASVAGLTLASPTFTGTVAGAGTIPNSVLANAATTVNGQTCTLGAACTVTSAATAVTVGTTTVGGGTTGRVLYDNAGVLGELVVTGSGSAVLATSPTMSGVTVTGSFTATGLVANAALVNAATTVNAQTCTLGSTCTVTVPVSTGITGLGTNVATFLATPSSANLAAALTDETGSGVAVFGTAPTISSPTFTTAFTATGLVTNAALASMSTSTIKGQTVGGSGAPVDLTAAQAAAVIGSVGGTLKSKLITTTRDLTAATGSVAYTGMGFTPTSCIAFGALPGVAVGNNTSWGLADSARTAGNIFGDANAMQTGAQFISFADVTGTNIQQATISSYDADGLTLSWTKTNVPTGTATIYILCFR